MTKRWITHKAKSRRYRKRMWKQRHLIRKNYGATFEIKPVYTKPGKKTKLLLLREDIEENLRVPDIPQERKMELKERLGALNQQLKRIQGAPPIEPVKGDFPSVVKLELLNRYKGTSSRRPAFVEELNLPLKERIPLNKERLRQTAREHFGISKGLDVISEKSLSEAAKGKEGVQVSLKDLRKGKRISFSSFGEGIKLIDTGKLKFGTAKWQGAMINNLKEKIKHKEELSPQERLFIDVQRQHNTSLYKKQK